MVSNNSLLQCRTSHTTAGSAPMTSARGTTQHSRGSSRRHMVPPSLPLLHTADLPSTPAPTFTHTHPRTCLQAGLWTAPPLTCAGGEPPLAPASAGTPGHPRPCCPPGPGPAGHRVQDTGSRVQSTEHRAQVPRVFFWKHKVRMIGPSPQARQGGHASGGGGGVHGVMGVGKQRKPPTRAAAIRRHKHPRVHVYE
jgi:hypothetical protein